MKKEFSSFDADRLSDLHEKLFYSVQKVNKLVNSSGENVKKSADKLAAKEIMAILDTVPVEELNRDKRGIRVSFLRNNGYNTVADVASASVYSLSTVYGISEDAAYIIKRVADEFAENARKEVKIKLTSDNKTKETTDVVSTVAKGLLLSTIKNTCDELMAQESKINTLIETLKPATSGIRWFFAGKAKKESAIAAYDELNGMLKGNYGNAANEIINKANQYQKISGEQAWNIFEKNNIQFYNVLEKTNPGLLGTNDSIYGLPEELAREVRDECFFPDGLLCTLRKYQEWGVKYILHQEKVLLGDEMGLGKTVQAIATMVSLKNTGATHFLVVCPASVVTNWCREIVKHSKLRAIKIHGSGKTSALKSWIKTGGVGVTTYETTSYFLNSLPFKLDMICVDEAHYIKNPDAIRSTNVRQICDYAGRILFMTGTALENKVEEMISLIEVLQPNVASSASNIAFMATAKQFRNRIAPVYYRRKREDVLTELPDLIENEDWCSLNKEEEIMYEDAILAKKVMDARRVSFNIEDLNKSCKAQRLKEIIEEAEAEDRKVIVFSFFLDTIRKIYAFLGTRCMDPINGSVSVQRRQQIIDEFDKAPAGAVLLAQINSGGTGLNIQSASVVVICEPQVKPSVENQAISRAYRMGQSRNVLVHRLLCENTIDEKMTEVLKEKQAIFDAFADESVAAKQQEVEIDEKATATIIEDELKRIMEKRGINPRSI